MNHQALKINRLMKMVGDFFNSNGIFLIILILVRQSLDRD